MFLVTVLKMSAYLALVRLADPDSESETWGKYFLPVGVFFASNFLDFVAGYLSAGLVKWPHPKNKKDHSQGAHDLARVNFLVIAIKLSLLHKEYV